VKEKNVQPLRTAKEVEDMKWALGRYCSERDKFMFTFGINIGLRVSDIVPLKVKDVLHKEHIIIREKKTKHTKTKNKVNRFKIPSKLREEIEDYTRNMDPDDYLFPSKKGGHITPTQAYRSLIKAAEVLGRDDIGTHTMRKTFGYFYYRRTRDLVFLQEIFNHTAPKRRQLPQW
jgi:integrase